jgi:dihydropteroate synthase
MVKLVGILNITPDSFSDGGKYNTIQNSILRVEELIRQGVSIIDIGAESTRPGALPITHKEEWQRLQFILPYVTEIAHKNNVRISIDSRHYLTIKKVLEEFSIDIINDVTGFRSTNMLNLAIASQKQIILMHNLGVPVQKSKIMKPNSDVVCSIQRWMQRKITFLTNQGIKKENIIFDPGIGFGKNIEQSWQILNNMDKFQDLGIEIFVGHSRKSFLESDDISSKDEKTLEISKFLISKGVDYLRVHNVELHNNLLTTDPFH